MGWKKGFEIKLNLFIIGTGLRIMCVEWQWNAYQWVAFFFSVGWVTFQCGIQTT